MRTARLAKLTLGISLVSVLVGCTSLWNPRNVTPPPLKPDSASQANFQALNSQLGDSCSAPILEPERSALLQEALADSQLQAVKAQLERRGLGMNADEAQAVQLVGGAQLVIPFGQDAHLVWTRTNGQTAAVGLVRQGNKTLNVGADGQERVVRVLSAQQAEKLLRKLRERSKFQEFEGKLAQKGKRVGKVRVMLDETNKLAIVGIAAEGDEKIAHQVWIKVKANKEDEPEEDAEPMIQATACGQASGEAVPTGARMQPLALPSGEGDFEGGYEGPQICTSQWGYDYLCTSTTPMLRLSLTGTSPTLALPQTFINQQVQGAFVIWNYGGGRLTGTVSAPAPFSIVSGGSFSLLPGQPQEVVVRFSSGTAGSFSRGIAISSNGGSATVTATAVAHKVSFSPASVDFGSGLLVLREQCDSMGSCGLRTEKVGLPIEKALTVKNEGTVSVSLTLSTAGPYKIVSAAPMLSPGQSAQVTLRFDPTESGSFTGTVQVGINGGQGSVTAPLVGTAHKIEISPAELDFVIVFLGSSRVRKLTVKNQGVTTVVLNTSAGGPYSLESPSSFTLTPGQSQDVRIRFTPGSSGVFSGNVRLGSGASFMEIPVTGEAMTKEEYRQKLLQAYNQHRQQCYSDPFMRSTTFDGDYGIGVLRAAISDRDEFLLVGFNEITPDMLINIEAMAGNYVDVPEAIVERLIELTELFAEFDNLDPNLVDSWLRRLRDALAAGRFDEEYSVLLQDTQFAHYHQLVGRLLETTDIAQIKAFLQGFVVTAEPSQERGWWWYYAERYLLPRLVASGRLTQSQVDEFKNKLRDAANKIGGPEGLKFMDAVAIVLFSFDNAHFNNQLGLPLPSYSEFISRLNFVLDKIIASSTDRTAWANKIVVAAQGALDGWLIMNIMVNLGGLSTGDPNGQFIDIVAWKNVTVRESGQTIRVVAFLKVDSRSWDMNMVNSPIGSGVIDTLKAINDHIAKSGNVVEIYGPGFYIIGVIFTRSQDSSVMNALAERVAREVSNSYPIFLAFKDKATGRKTVIVICPAGGCPAGTMEAAGEAACGFAFRVLALMGNITYICDNGQEVDIIFKRKS
jgi:P pilus assembly chaperone PapD